MRIVAACAAVGLTIACASGDQLLVLGGQTREGTFQGFEGGKFLFLPSRGKFMKETPSRVSRLVLANKTKATYQTTDGKSESDAVLKGYEKGKFIFLKDGKETAVIPMKIKQLDLSFETGGDAGGGSYPIPAVDLATLGGELTQEQQGIVDRFVAAKKSFDEFLAESSAVVAEMDKLKGPKREELLNKLRMRKEAEQPLRDSLRIAYRALVGAFSEPDGAAEQPAKPEPAKPAAGRAAGGLRSLAK
jgi:hypothetical protein